MADDSRLCDTNVLSSFYIVLSVRGVITKAIAADLWHVHMALVSRPGSVSEESTGDRKEYANNRLDEGKLRMDASFLQVCQPL